MSARLSLTDCIEAIESNYEFMLAYAAQGRDFESAGGDGPSIRAAIEHLRAGLMQLPERFRERLATIAEPSRQPYADFCELLATDATRARTAVDLVLSVGNIGSQLIDNLNASSHVRALLTDLFLIDEAANSLSTTMRQ